MGGYNGTGRICKRADIKKEMVTLHKADIAKEIVTKQISPRR